MSIFDESVLTTFLVMGFKEDKKSPNIFRREFKVFKYETNWGKIYDYYLVSYSDISKYLYIKNTLWDRAVRYRIKTDDDIIRQLKRYNLYVNI
jgi:hypothetical protein